MSGRATPATEALRRAGVAFELREYEPGEPPRAGERRVYGLEAADALGVDPERIFKTLVASVDGGLAVGIVPVSAELDLKALASAVGGRKGAMAKPEDAERATGYLVGGISPFGQKRRLPVAIEASCLEQERILVSGGRRGMQIEIAPAELVRVLGAQVAPIARRN